MKRPVYLILILVLIASALIGCSSASSGKIYGMDDKNISAGIGETFTILLDENPTTGYQWVSSISDDSIVNLETSDFKEKPADTVIVGAGGQRIMTFKGLKTGTTAITLSYERSWEKNSPAQTLVYNITVR